MIPRRTVIVVPLKDFNVAKSRLRSSFSNSELDALARRLAEGVVRAAGPRECVLASDAAAVREFALRCGVPYLSVSAGGLNAAVNDALAQLRGAYDVAVIAHGDLAHPVGLGDYEFADGVTVVTDRHGTGTNVMAIPLESEFVVHYGVNSAVAHEREAHAHGLSVRTITDSPWGLDIDEPADWELAQAPRT